MATVVNKRTSAYDVYIGRGSKWGNPFVMKSEADRERVIEQFREHLWELIKTGVITKDELRALDGKRLGCFRRGARTPAGRTYQRGLNSLAFLVPNSTECPYCMALREGPRSAHSFTGTDTYTAKGEQ